MVAITLEVDGKNTGPFGSWEGYNDFLITQARWLTGGEHPDDVFLNVEQSGQDALVTLEFDPERARATQIQSPVLTVVPPGDDKVTPLQIPFEWQGANTLQARFRLTRTGTYRPLVKLGPQTFVRGPTITLPYSAEFSPRPLNAMSGVDILKNLAAKTGGQQRLNPLEILAHPPRSASTQPLAPWLLILVVGLLITEIAGRRLSLWERIREVIPEIPVPKGIPLSKMFPKPRASLGGTGIRGSTLSAGATSSPASVATPTTAANSPATTSREVPFDPFLAAKQRAKRREG